MIYKMAAPRMGEGVTQVNVIRWLKQAGEAVREYEPLVEVETDKVATEIPSPVDGILARILITAGQVAQVGDTLADIETAAESAKPEIEPEMIEPKTTPVDLPAPTEVEPRSEPINPERAWISPIVARIARENRVDLGEVHGSGLNGRITKQDMLDFLSAKPAAAKTTPASSAQILPISSIRRQIAQRMVDSIHTAPHVLTVMEADMSLVLDDLEKRKAEFADRGVKLTLTAYFIQSIAQALRNTPLVNASWSETGILLHNQVHIGIAVSLGEEGLIVPVIRSADTLNLFGTSAAIQDLAQRARGKRLTAEDVKGATFTLTNHGTGGSLFAAPIISQPQTGILGTGQVQKRVIVLTDASGHDAIAIRPMVYLSFVFDHRILDGSTADQFLRQVKTYLEDGSFQ